MTIINYQNFYHYRITLDMSMMHFDNRNKHINHIKEWIIENNIDCEHGKLYSESLYYWDFLTVEDAMRFKLVWDGYE